MKKVIIAMVAVFALGMTANAQNLGVRLGGGHSGQFELSYQMGLGSNRVEWDLGLSASNESVFHLDGIYQFTGTIAGNFGWYAGLGAQVGYCENHGFGLGVVAQLGVEYNFDAIPIQVSFDVRPSYEFILPEGCAAGAWDSWSAALGIRYRF